MTPQEAALLRAVGDLRIELARVKAELRQERAKGTTRAELDNGLVQAEAEAWLRRLPVDPDASKHREAILSVG